MQVKIMLKIIFYVLSAAALFCGGISAGGDAESLLPAGSCSTMLRNSRLELEAGDFPAGWSFRINRPDYFPNGFPQGGGCFKFHRKGKMHIVRQDWTFSIEPGELYRLSAWVKAGNFTAGRAELLSFNNGWSQSSGINIPQGSYGWKRIEKVFRGYSSRGGVGSVGIVVDRIRSGEFEIAGITLEPASQKAYEASIAYLKEIPPQKLIPLEPKLNAVENTLKFRWYGDKKVRSISWQSGSGSSGKAKINNAIAVLDLHKLVSGRHILTCTAGDVIKKFNIIKRDKITEPQNAVRKNNLHTLLAEFECKDGFKSSFLNPRDGWVSFQLADNMKITIPESKVPLSGSMPVYLRAGKYDFTVSGSGRVCIAAIAETIYYQLAGGPHLTGFPKHDFEMVKKHQLDCITTFNNGSPGSEKNWQIFRKQHNNLLLAHSTVADGTAQPPSVRGTGSREWRFDGAILDEFSSGNEKQLALVLKNSGRYDLAPGKSIYCWMTGTPQNSAVTAGFMSMAVNELNGKLLFEAYVPSNTANEKEARKLILDKMLGAVNKFEAVYPGFRKYLGMVISPSNIPLSFTVDNEPEANFKYFLDMQMNILATHPAFDGIGAVGCWGGNHTDNEVTRWVSALFRHYVIEGKTNMLSAEFGWKLAENILKNCSFAAGIQHWNCTGEVKIKSTDNYAAVMKYFGNLPGAGNNYAVLPPGSSIGQKTGSLIPGKLYKLSFISSNALDPVNGRAYRSRLNTSLKGGKILPEHTVKYRKSPFASQNAKMGKANFDMLVFRAEQTQAEITFSPDEKCKDPVALHRVSIVPFYDNDR